MQKTRTVAYRLAGRVLASFITHNMDEVQVARILGMPDASERLVSDSRRLAIVIGYGAVPNAAGDHRVEVCAVVIYPLLD